MICVCFFQIQCSEDSSPESTSNRVEQVRRNYLKLKPLFRRLLQLDDHDTFDLLFKAASPKSRLDSEEDEAAFLSDLGRVSSSAHQDYEPSPSKDHRFFKRAYLPSSSERFDRLGKGKRVKNMFSSGLQGVWGVPGRK
jgi:hypothetical protein